MPKDNKDKPKDNKDKKPKTKTAIYHPPKSGMPYLVATVSPEGVNVTAVSSKEEARILASKKAIKIYVEDSTGGKTPEG